MIVALLPCPPASAQLKIDCQGQGAPLFLIGGGPAFTTWHLEPIQKRLAAHYRVCRWDMRGVGSNARWPLNQERPALTQWLEDMAVVLPEEPVLLWGHSWGALQSLMFAKHYPQRVKALILSNPVDPALNSLGYIEQKRVQHPDPDGALTLDDYGTGAETRHNFHAKIASYFVDARQGWNYARQFEQSDFNSGLNVRIWEEYRAQPLAPQALKTLTPKVKGIVYCEHDVLMPQNHRAYTLLFPATRHRVLKDCSHFPWVERPQAYFEVLGRLLRDAKNN